MGRKRSAAPSFFFPLVIIFLSLTMPRQQGPNQGKQHDDCYCCISAVMLGTLLVGILTIVMMIGGYQDIMKRMDGLGTIIGIIDKDYRQAMNILVKELSATEERVVNDSRFVLAEKMDAQREVLDETLLGIDSFTHDMNLSFNLIMTQIAGAILFILAVPSCLQAIAAIARRQSHGIRS
jgi:hypothetical protein